MSSEVPTISTRAGITAVTIVFFLLILIVVVFGIVPLFAPEYFVNFFHTYDP